YALWQLQGDEATVGELVQEWPEENGVALVERLRHVILQTPCVAALLRRRPRAQRLGELIIRERPRDLLAQVGVPARGSSSEEEEGPVQRLIAKFARLLEQRVRRRGEMLFEVRYRLLPVGAHEVGERLHVQCDGAGWLSLVQLLDQRSGWGLARQQLMDDRPPLLVAGVVAEELPVERIVAACAGFPAQTSIVFRASTPAALNVCAHELAKALGIAPI